MKRIAIGLAATAVGLLPAGPLTAGHLPPVDPPVAGADHNHENHSGHDHAGVNVLSIDLRWADLSSANLSSANLSSADLSFARFENAILTDADLAGADMRNPMLLEAINEVQLRHAGHITTVNLSGNDLSNFTIVAEDFTSANLHLVNVLSTEFHSSNLTGVDLRSPIANEAITARAFDRPLRSRM